MLFEDVELCAISCRCGDTKVNNFWQIDLGCGSDDI